MKSWLASSHGSIRFVDISGGTPAAHYPGEYQEAGGIMFPTKHDIFPRQPDNTPDRELLVVSTSLSNFDLEVT